MLIFTTLRRPEYSLARSSSIGAIDLHGPHHSAQKSSSTGVSDFSTSVSKSASLTWVMFSLMGGPATGRCSDKVGEKPRDCKRGLLQSKQALGPDARIV